MRSLVQALQEHELIVLRVMGEWYELDLTGADKMQCVRELAEVLSRLDMVQEMAFLSPEEAAALQALVAAGGRMPVGTFERMYGEVRQMGPGRLEREEPWLEPVSAAEALWYRGFLYRGFDETPEGLIEFYFVPDELLAQFPSVKTESVRPVAMSAAVSSLMPVAPPDVLVVQTAVSDAVDDLTTILALAQRTALQPDRLDGPRSLLLDPHPDRRSLLMTLAYEMGLLRKTAETMRPTRVAVDWLKQNREAQLRALADAWSSSAWNDLCHTPDLHCEGEGWQNDPILARTALLDVLPRRDDWFLLADLVAYMREHDPDFQRPDGNYDTWYIRDVTQDEYVRGFENWERVEGRLIRFLITGPLTWLGMVETAVSPELPDTLFRLSPVGLRWLTNQPVPTDEVRVPLVVRPDATLVVPHNADRYVRFQVARISEAEPVVRGEPFVYRLTPRSLQAAQEQGIRADRILQFLAEASGRPVPVSVRRGITRWAENGMEARLETAVILRVRQAGILQTLRTNPKTRHFITEVLGDMAAVVRREDWQALQRAVAELGLLLDCDVQASEEKGEL
ncbi:MAG: hypothetical protein D6706_17895 [Chloroflexi bacterium]|nr:MAG: hypothetical protein D6706_17895 [Chloroflexota bacterium]